MALIGVLIVICLLMSLAVSLAFSVIADTQLRGALGRSLGGFYAAEAGLNQGIGEYKNIFLAYNVPSGADFDERSFALGDRDVVYGLTPRANNPQSVVIPSGELFSGLNAIQYRYIVNSHAENALSETEASVGAEFLVGYIPLFQFVAFYTGDLEIAPGPLMNLNGRVHTNGNLYLNANDPGLYIADKPAAKVFTVQVSSAEDIYRGRKDTNTCTGNVTVDMLRDTVSPFGDLDPRGLPCNGGGTRLVPISELAQWQGSMVSRIDNIAVPEPDIIAKGSGAYWQHADLRIVLVLGTSDSIAPGITLPNAIEVQDVDGLRNTSKTAQLHAFMADKPWNTANSGYPGTVPIFYTDVPLSGSGCGCANGTPTCGNATATCYSPRIPAPPLSADASRVYGSDMKFDGDYRRGGFYNQREGKWMRLLDINVADLLLWNQQHGSPFFANSDNTDGGLVIFASVEGPNSNTTNNYGVRLFGSANLPIPGGIGVSADPTGLTVASDQAMYVLGDYNRGPISAGDLPRQPASIIGDSVNILSQRYWLPGCIGNYCRDGQSVRPLSETWRDGATTWINAAFLGGVDTTPASFPGSGAYNGGLENYPRFHEDLAGFPLNYQGSFVSLGEPQHVRGAWCGTGNGCNIYNPPDRNWNYDPAFNDAANLPPLTPRFVYVQQVLFTEDFK